jgi:hypothetical protein
MVRPRLAGLPITGAADLRAEIGTMLDQHNVRRGFRQITRPRARATNGFPGNYATPS